eukprot:Clim_evm78s218 gene=Clim_evmTU78s218
MADSGLERYVLNSVTLFIEGFNWLIFTQGCTYLYFIFMITDLRQLQGGRQFTLKHPLTSYITAVLVCLGSTVVTGLLTGTPAIPLDSSTNYIAIFVIWYVIFFIPKGFAISRYTPLYQTGEFFTRIRRVAQICRGINMATGIIPKIIVGTFKAQGSIFMSRMVLHLIKRNDTAKEAKYHVFPATFKWCLYASMLLVLWEEQLLPFSATYDIKYLRFGLIMFMANMHYDALNGLEAAASAIFLR